tara:strand:+ start:1933 stop:2430 length:498 start_codon:yes stop_codon:yes gene_type:complete
MGFDVYGLNPRVNEPEENFKVYYKFQNMEFSDRLKILDTNEKIRKQYWEEYDKFESANPGVYFRNNCWWWRPLWDYVCIHCKSLTSEDHNSGHYNDGHEISEEKATLIGLALKSQLKEGVVRQYKEEYEESERLNGDEDYSYPFSEENVEAFAEFCLQSGGFTIH